MDFESNKIGIEFLNSANERLTESLLNNGANCNLLNLRQKNPLHWAVINRKFSFEI